MSEPAPKPADHVANHDAIRGYLKERESNDLVFAVAGYLGSGCSWVANALSEQLRAAHFTPYEIKLSTLISNARGLENRGTTLEVRKTRELQLHGDELRNDHGNSIVAGLAIREIHALRQTPATAQARAFILDSLKNPAEVEVLRTVYGSSFYLIGVLANDDTRFDRLRLKYKSESCEASEKDRRIRELMDRDQAGTEEHEQQVRKTIKLSDFFIANEGDDLGTELARFIAAVSSPEKIIRPTPHEKGMHAAWGSALKSSCLSRQVGAAIISANGEILATGTNDPPSPEGGVYDSSRSYDYRCFKYPDSEYAPTSGFCRNDRIKAQIYQQVFDEMKAAGLLSQSATPGSIRRALSNTRIKDLIEFSRAIHAEMDAVLALTRTGTRLPPRSTTLLCTTYPCHSCARHIIAAGIAEVVYIEPYPKSMALELHSDAIHNISVAGTETPELSGESVKKVIFRLFTGVAPRAFSSLFEKRGEVKDSKTGILVNIGARVPRHGLPILTGSFLDLEKDVAQTTEQLITQEISSV